MHDMFRKFAFDPFRISWYEGMPLNPQNLQQNDNLMMNTVQYLFANLFQHGWGVKSLEWDLTYFSEGVLRIKRVEGIMPDRSLIFYPFDKGDVLELNLMDKKDVSFEHPQTVWIILPDNHNAHDHDASVGRYSIIESGPFKDLNNGVEERSVFKLRPKFSLYLGPVPPTRYISLPIARIHCADMSFSIMEYDPPSILAGPYLKGIVAKLIALARDKLRYLSSNHEEIAVHSKSIMVSIAKGVWQLEHLMNEESVHPIEFFNALLNFMSECLSLHSGETIPIVPKYNHLDVLASCTVLTEFIEMSLGNIRESYTRKVFEFKDGMYKIDSVSIKSDKIIFGVRVYADSKRIYSWVENLLIASDDKIGLVRDSRLLGAKRRAIEYDEHLGITATSDMLLFEIDNDIEFITSGKSLVILNIDKEIKAEIILFLPNA